MKFNLHHILKHCKKEGGCDVHPRSGHDMILETGEVVKSSRGNSDTMAAQLVKQSSMGGKYNTFEKPKAIDEMNGHFDKISALLLKRRQENFYGGVEGMGGVYGRLGGIIRGVESRKGDIVVILVLLVLLFLWIR